MRLKPNITILLFISWMLAISITAQSLISKGNLNNIQYAFKGEENYKSKQILTHALAYAHSKDVGDVEASILYTTHFQTIKLKNNGFKTIIRLGPEQISGLTQLYHFDFENFILPQLKTISLYMFKGDDLIYLKKEADLVSEGESLYFTFFHQRYNQDWKLELKNPIWHFSYSEENFIKAWNAINQYQMISAWLKEIDQWESSSTLESYVIKSRFLCLLQEMKSSDSYRYCMDTLQQDPEELERRLNISIFKTQKDLELLNKSLTDVKVEEFTRIYLQFEYLLLGFQEKNMSLYGDLYHSFRIDNYQYFNQPLIEEFIQQNDQENFENLYQKLALDLIQELIEQKKTNEALLQIERFETFFKHSVYLKKSSTFQHFRARAVYDVYLSYIQVSKQALEHDQIDLAIQYLDKASGIQQKYSAEIINNVLVEKAMRNLIKKGMARYQNLLNQGKTNSAKKVKQGILELMKRLGLEPTNYPIG